MMLRMRIQSALRLLPLWLVLCSLNIGILVGLLAVRAASLHAPLSAGAITALAWAGIAAYLAVSGVRQRSSAFELTLPVSARRLWVAHVASTLAIAAILAFALAGVAATQFRLLDARRSLTIHPLHLAALLAGGAMLALALLELPHRESHRIPLHVRSAIWSVAVLAGVAVLLGGLAPLGIAAALVPVALACVVGGLFWRALPPSFTLLARTPARAAEEETTAAPSASLPQAAARARRVVLWTIVRCVGFTPKDAVAYPLILLFGLMLGGALSSWTGDADLEDLRFFYIPMATYVLFALTGPRLATLHHLDPLPIPRSRLLVWLLLPHLACFVLGYGVGALSARLRPAAGDLVQLVEIDGVWRVRVPVWARAIAWDGRVPAVGVPGQETHVPHGFSLWPGTRAVLYSPYDTPPGSSLRFVAEQIERATSSLYVTAIPADEIAARYLEARADGSVAPRAGGMPLRVDFPALQPRSAGPLLPLFLTLVVAPWLVLVAGLFRTFRPDIGPARGQQFVWSFIGLFVVLFIVLFMLIVRGVIHSWVPRAVVGIAARALGDAPAAVAATWLGMAVLLGLGFGLVGRQFRRMEVPTRALRFSLLDMSREEG